MELPLSKPSLTPPVKPLSDVFVGMDDLGMRPEDTNISAYAPSATSVTSSPPLTTIAPAVISTEVMEKKEPPVEKKESLVEKKEPLVEKKESVVEKKEPPVEKKDGLSTMEKESSEAMQLAVEISMAGQQVESSACVDWGLNNEWKKRLSQFPLYGDKMEGTLMILQAAKVGDALETLLHKDVLSKVQIGAIRGYLLINPLLRQTHLISQRLPGIFLSLVPTYYLLHPAHLKECLKLCLDESSNPEVTACAHLVLTVMGVELPSAFLHGRKKFEEGKYKLERLKKQQEMMRNKAPSPTPASSHAPSSPSSSSSPSTVATVTPPISPTSTSDSSTVYIHDSVSPLNIINVADKMVERKEIGNGGDEVNSEVDVHYGSNPKLKLDGPELDKYVLREASLDDVGDLYDARQEFVENYRTIDGETLLSLAIECASVHTIVMVARLCPILIGTFDENRSSILTHIPKIVTRLAVVRAVSVAINNALATNHFPPIACLIMHDLLTTGGKGLDLLAQEGSCDLRIYINTLSEQGLRKMASELSMEPTDPALISAIKIWSMQKKKLTGKAH